LVDLAQQTVDPKIEQQIRVLAEKYDEAFNNNHAAAVAASARATLGRSAEIATVELEITLLGAVICGRTPQCGESVRVPVDYPEQQVAILLFQASRVAPHLILQLHLGASFLVGRQPVFSVFRQISGIFKSPAPAFFRY
jgi:hypothetical protein